MRLKEAYDLAACFDPYRPAARAHAFHAGPDGYWVHITLPTGEARDLRSGDDEAEAHEWLRKRGCKRAQPMEEAS